MSKKKFNKKAAMELGISTVVMLVIAMVIIAGGIAFIRGFFAKGTDSLSGAFNVGDFGVQPTSVTPLVVVDGAISIKQKSSKSIKIGYYNNKGADLSGVKVMFDGDCIGPVADKKPVMTSLAMDVDTGESVGFVTQTEVPDGMVPGAYTCKLVAKAGTDIIVASTQVVVTITS